MGLPDAQSVHQSNAVFGKKPGGIVHVRLIAPSQPPVIIDQDLIVLGKLWHLKNPPGGQANARSRDENQRVALSIELVIKVNVIHFDFSALNGCDFRHCQLLPGALQPLKVSCRQGDAIESARLCQ
jgi:hypothetical protein